MISLSVIPAIAALTLTNRSATILTCEGREQTVAIHWLRNSGIGYNSTRPTFVCRCGYGAFRLYDVFGEFRCQPCATAFGVRYASQQVSRNGRQYLQSQRLRRFLGEYPSHCSCTTRPTAPCSLDYARSKPSQKTRKYKSKRLTERTFEVAHIANV